jgi:matrixin
MTRARRSWVLPALLLCGCGGGGGGGTGPTNPGTPTPTAAPSGPSPAGTVLSIVSGETGAPVAGASVTVAGRAYVANSGGQVVLAETAAENASVEVSSGAFLERQSLLRSPAATRFTLWPRSSPTGIDEDYTATLVYTDVGGAVGTKGMAELTRLRGAFNQVFIIPSAAIQADATAMAAHQQAAAALTAATGSQIVYVVAAQRPATGIVFNTEINPGDTNCTDRTLAFTSFTTRDSEIFGGRLTFCNVEASSTTVMHELGHTFGLQHSRERTDVMYAFLLPDRPANYTPREVLTMNLMLQRRGGNLFPDNDRGVTARSVRETVIRCPE